MQYVDELKVVGDSDRDLCMAETGVHQQGRLDHAQLQEQVGLSGAVPFVNDLMWKIGQQRLPQLPERGIPSAAELDDDGTKVTGRRRRRCVDAVGHFPSTSPLTACTSCLRDHQWQSLTDACGKGETSASVKRRTFEFSSYASAHG